MLGRYANWLHLRWPAGLVEKLPDVRENGATNIPGVYVVGDLTGIPLLKFASDSGARAITAILADPNFKRSNEILDVAIIGGGVSGVAAAMAAKKAGLSFQVFESTEIFSTVRNFPKGKPIFTYPTEMIPEGDLQLHGQVKEALCEELEGQRLKAGIVPVLKDIDHIERKGRELVLQPVGIRAQRVIIAIGRSGKYRKLGCPGEELDKVYNRLHDPKDFTGQNVLVVGGGDSAVETANALTDAGAKVILSYRGKSLTRPKEGNRPFPSVTMRLGTVVETIESKRVLLNGETLPNDTVFTMLGREAPLDFFHRSGIRVRGEWRASTYLSFAAFFGLCFFIFSLKGSTSLNALFKTNNWFPFSIGHEPGYLYSILYTVLVVVFGFRRIRRRKSKYVTLQTYALMAIQVIPLFILPYFVLPYLGRIGFFESGAGKWIGDQFFPNGEYWRSFGFVLAWPLFIWNAFSEQPLWGWLIVSFLQTFVLIPLLVWKWGKGAYCGWICSCGALAETLGDAHRGKMPHGPFWNRLNMLGQVILALAFFLLLLRVTTWIYPNGALKNFYYGLLSGWALSYYSVVDLFLSGIVGVGLYFHFSGRVWCRFACPLAALMHLYARFSKFRIFAEKAKCISCNVCTSVCHQGIDVMSFANKGIPMNDPQCVACAACVTSCPTDVLSFKKREDRKTASY